MNPTPKGGATGPSPDAAGPDAGPPDHAVPAQRPLPRRVRTRTGVPAVPAPERGYDPDGRPFDPVDDESLHRLLSGLRDI